MGFIIGVPYYAITAADYQDLCDLLGASFVSADFNQTYTDPDTHITYYLALQSDIDPTSEAPLYDGVGFPTINFGSAYFTSSVQANISMPS